MIRILRTIYLYLNLYGRLGRLSEKSEQITRIISHGMTDYENSSYTKKRKVLL